MSGSDPTLAIVGVTGAVGREMLDILASRGVPVSRLLPLASARSAGTTIAYLDGMMNVEELTEGSLAEADIALFSAGATISRAFGPRAAAAGVTVIDNSSAFRMDKDVSLVIPEVNGDVLDGLGGDGGGGGAIIANPNCSAIIMLMALTPMRNAFGIKRVVVSTYQAASGAGAAAMDELSAQSARVLDGGEAEPSVFPEPCAFNVFSHNSAVDGASGQNVEEQKMIEETRKIWDDPDLAVSTTCIRVPVLRAHAESINVELSRPATEAEVRAALADFAGVCVVDDREANDFPTSLKAAGGDDVLVGRVRPDVSLPHDGRGESGAYTGFDLFVAGDQLRKGAALNAIQIMDRVLAGSPASA